MLRVGLIADTHGLLRPEATAFLAGSDHIVHAGDVGDSATRRSSTRLRRSRRSRRSGATSTRTRGRPGCAKRSSIRFASVASTSSTICRRSTSNPRAAGIRVVVSGHSHKPLVFERDGVLYVNPGSAGPRRFRLPIAAAELFIDGSTVSARIHELAAG